MGNAPPPSRSELAHLPKTSQRDILDFMTISAAPVPGPARAAETIRASIATALALSEELRH